MFLSPTGVPWGTFSNNITRIFARSLLNAGIEKIDQAFNTVAESHSDVILRLDGITTVDSRGMNRLVERITDLKNKDGLRVFVVAKTRQIQTAFHKARGHMVAGVYEDKDKALSAFRSV